MRVAGALSAAVVTLVLSGCGIPSDAAAPSRVPSSPASAAPSPAPTAVIDVPVGPATAEPVRTAVPPERVVVSSMGVDVPVIPVSVVEGGFMELPEDPGVAGWYRYGADPSSTEGNVVISAHVDSPYYPIGPFSQLRDLSAGTVAEVIDAAGAVHRYVVATVTYYPKPDLPVDALFARTGTPSLVLITCGGAYDSASGRYAENIVVVATPGQ